MKKYFMIGCFLLIIAGAFAANSFYFRLKLWQYEVAKNPAKTRILLGATVFFENGATRMLLELAEVLQKNGYNVAMIGTEDGVMNKDVKRLGIPLLIDKRLVFDEKMIRSVAKDFDLAVSNTFVMSYFNNIVSESMPSILWVHEMEEGFISGRKIINDTKNIPALVKNKSTLYYTAIAPDVVLVSQMQADLIAPILKGKSYLFNNIINEEHTKAKVKHKEGTYPIRFVTVGYIRNRKAQDVLIDAIRLLPQEYLDKASFTIVGYTNNNEFAQNLIKESKDIKQVHWTGGIEHRNIHKIYENADVLVFPSIYDTAPLVVQEAAVNKIPAIITTKNGSTFITKDNYSGFIVPISDPQALRDKLMWFIDNPDKISAFGDRAYKYYQETSSKEVFERKWLDLIESKLNNNK